MIQRIQTLYLLVVVVLFSTMIVNPIMGFTTEAIDVKTSSLQNGKPDVKVVKETKVYEMNYKGIVDMNTGEKLVETTLVTLYEVIVAVIALFSVFLFKVRPLQIRLTIFNTVLQVGFYAIVGIYVYMAKSVAQVDMVFHLPIVFPAVAAVLSYLAFRAIMKDELLVRSLNRVR